MSGTDIPLEGRITATARTD
ncbi:hypothetical protein [Bacterioplanoides pacificum]|uniref:Uncharacterized protein n=1 Tax=Bacterioplanoides pacificum TaxID=1171596 RepID=A0ABV7VXF9_9GAMM